MADGPSGAEVKDALVVKELYLSDLKVTSAMEEANGTNTVTISNVAPAGVGTATISKWLKFTGSNGVVYYIPAWT